MPLSLKGLQALLKEEEEKEANDEKAEFYKLTDGTSERPSEASIDVDRSYLACLRKELLDRPIPATLFRCPISQAQTTLVQWDSLSRKLQDQVLKNHPNCYNVTALDVSSTDLDRRAVEIPKSYLDSVVAATEDPNQMQQAALGMHSTMPRLQGNLRDKLSEYTRGLTGQARPFRPGGVNDELDLSKQVDDPYRTAEAMSRHRQVLEQWPTDSDKMEDAVESMWNEGLLLTAPLGVDFKVGLAYCKDSVDGKSHSYSEQAREISENFYQDPSETGKNEERSNPAGGTTVRSQSLFQSNAAYFVENEIDSLFGSSSGTESVYDEDDDEEGAQGDEAPYEDIAGTVELDLSTFQENELDDKHSKPREETNDEEIKKEEEEIDVDLLLSELTELASGRKPKPVFSNPLSIAQRQARDQHDATRKAWANTKLLPIDDFETYLPNPALAYPFTLDGFQQQAIARLERSENVFVAAHTSAGKNTIYASML